MKNCLHINTALGPLIAFAFGVVLVATSQQITAQQVLILDDFNDDIGELTGHPTNTGQVWEAHTADWNQGPLSLDTRYGQQNSVGAGHTEPAAEHSWRANVLPLGTMLNEGAWVLGIDIDQESGAHEPNVALESTDGSDGVTIIWSGTKLKCGGNLWAGQIDIGSSGGQMHFDLTVNLNPEAPQKSTASIRYYHVDNPALNGGLELGHPAHMDRHRSRGLEFTRVSLAAGTESHARLGFDNLSVSANAPATVSRAIELGQRRELFVDYFLIDKLEGLELRMGQPKNNGVVFPYDRPWEGIYSGYGVMMKLADDEFRYYYRGSPRLIDTTHGKDVEKQTCIAFSNDGIHWERPWLREIEVHDTKDNNVFFKDDFLSHNFAPFLDKPGTPATARFKAIAGERFTGLVVFSSEDGIHWKKMFGGQPVLQGKYLDAMNVAFWSKSEQRYIFYGRTWKKGWGGTRWIARATSDDLQHWTPLEDVRILHNGDDVPVEHYYHTGISPYFRAPHIYVSLCSQITNGQVLSSEEVATLDIEYPGRAKSRSGGGLMTSRGDHTFQRTFMEEFIRPPIGPENWIARCNYPVVGVVQTGPAEMSIYVDIHSGQPTRSMRRYSLRLDGFASLHAPLPGGHMVTKPFKFNGERLSINYATSSRGDIRFQFETPKGDLIEGFRLEECDELVGNAIERYVTFNGSSDLGRLVGKPLCLRVSMHDADLYSLQFKD